MKPVIAIVGRPNVGKSTLFNRIIGRRYSIVEDTPGVTRDRIYYETEWNGRQLILVDTGGIEPKTNSDMLRYMRRQAEIAVENADIIVFLMDVMTGVTADDREIAVNLKKSGKPVIPCVNKADDPGDPPPDFYEFYSIAFDEEPIAVSGLHGTGTGDLLDRIVELLPPETEIHDDDGGRIRVCAIGRPNVGSSLVNRMVGSSGLSFPKSPVRRGFEDVDFDNEFGASPLSTPLNETSEPCRRIDRIFGARAKMAVERSDVCLVVIDQSTASPNRTPASPESPMNRGKRIIVVNKWDLVEKDQSTMNEYTDHVRSKLAYMSYAPVVFVSALSGQRCDRLYPLITRLSEEAGTRITTGRINDMLSDAVIRVQPPSDRGRRLKIFYMTQTGTKPPTFVVFVNRISLFHFSYQRYLENQIREVFGLKNVPIRLIPRQRGENPSGNF